MVTKVEVLKRLREKILTIDSSQCLDDLMVLEEQLTLLEKAHEAGESTDSFNKSLRDLHAQILALERTSQLTCSNSSTKSGVIELNIHGEHTIDGEPISVSFSDINTYNNQLVEDRLKSTYRHLFSSQLNEYLSQLIGVGGHDWDVHLRNNPDKIIKLSYHKGKFFLKLLPEELAERLITVYNENKKALVKAYPEIIGERISDLSYQIIAIRDEIDPGRKSSERSDLENQVNKLFEDYPKLCELV